MSKPTVLPYTPTQRPSKMQGGKNRPASPLPLWARRQEVHHVGILGKLPTSSIGQRTGSPLMDILGCLPASSLVQKTRSPPSGCVRVLPRPVAPPSSLTGDYTAPSAGLVKYRRLQTGCPWERLVPQSSSQGPHGVVFKY